MEAMPREDVQAYIDVFRSTVPLSAYNTVHYISTDNPSNLMWQVLYQSYSFNSDIANSIFM
jgi:hypothetical protein